MGRTDSSCTMRDKLNIVLVHGAFGDGSHWEHIIPGLCHAGHRAMAAQNPLTSLAGPRTRGDP